MRIIPAIDIIDGKCVRLTKGAYDSKKIYNDDPLEVAKEFEAHGIQFLHLVDLDGAKSGGVVNYKILERIASNTSLRIDFGGGVKSDKDIHTVFESGARQVTGGSIAVKNKKRFLHWLEQYGADKLILGADAREEKVAVAGWSEETDMQLIPFISEYLNNGIKYVICTDISKDGMLEGPAVELYKKILKKTEIIKTTIGPSGVIDLPEKGVNLIASGGVTELSDLSRLKLIGCEGVIIGKAIYENRISLKELENHILTLRKG